MKTSIKNLSVVKKQTFPALFRLKGSELVVLATDRNRGVVIHGPNEPAYKIGHVFNGNESNVPWDCITAWERINEPVEITFTP